MLRIPSLTHLTTFVTVGRRRSFRKAAEDLMLTSGAISQQIQGLEKQLGCRLLNRSNREVTFTEKGQRFYTAVAPLITEISDVTQQIFGLQRKASIIVSVMPDFALHWLIPRLDTFHKQYPEVTVNINATERLVDFNADDVDIAIRHGLGNYPDLEALHLFSENLVPVCSPRLLGEKGQLDSASDLRRYTLLHDSIAKDWSLFLSALGVEDVKTDVGPQFDSDSLMIQSAIEGHGVALARASLVAADIKHGRLIIPFDQQVPSKFAYYIVFRKKRQLRSPVALFRDWLLDQSKCYSDQG